MFPQKNFQHSRLFQTKFLWVGAVALAWLCCMPAVLGKAQKPGVSQVPPAARQDVVEQLSFGRQVLLPDGSPAAGARIVVRQFSPADGKKSAELTLFTDVNGRFSTTAGAISRDLAPASRFGYLIVSAPHCAPVFSSFTEWMRSEEAQALPIRLQKAFSIPGRVLASNGHPVAGATVVPTDFRNNYSYPWKLNSPQDNVATPELSAVSDAQGQFLLPGFTLDLPRLPSEGFESVPTASLIVTGFAGAVVLSGYVRDVYVSLRPIGGAPPLVAVLSPARTVSGQVIDAVTQQPITGALVQAFPGDPGMTVNPAPVLTDNHGRFRLTDLPVSPELFIEASRPPNRVDQWVSIPLKTSPSSAPASNDLTPEIYDKIIIPLRRWTVISGRIVDETGKPVQIPFDIHAVPLWPAEFTNMSCSQGSAETRADGTFHLRAAEGHNELFTLSGAGPGCYSFAGFTDLDRDVPRGGRSHVVWHVKRLDAAFVVHLIFPPGKKSYNYQVDPTDNSHGPVRSNLAGTYLSWSTKKPSDKMPVRIKRIEWVKEGNFATHIIEVLPGTELSADPKNWPTVIRLP